MHPSFLEVEVFEDMLDKMDNETFLEQFPLFHAMMKKMKNKTAEEDEDEDGEKKPKIPPVLVEMVTRCAAHTTGFETHAALFGERME